MKPLTPEEQKAEFETAYLNLRTFVTHKKGPALALATVWHLEQIKTLKEQIKNLQAITKLELPQ